MHILSTPTSGRDVRVHYYDNSLPGLGSRLQQHNNKRLDVVSLHILIVNLAFSISFRNITELFSN
jgi:hypothetical protein